MYQAPSTIFGEIRSLLHKRPTPQRWDELCGLVLELPTPQRTHTALPYVLDHLRTWPDHLRRSPTKWLDRLLAGKTASCWPMVRALDCSGKVIGHAVGVALAELLTPDTITALIARRVHIGPYEIATLLDTPHAETLTWLDWNATPLDTDCLDALAACDHLDQVEHLAIGGCRIGNAGLARLAEATNLTGLTSLDLHDARIGLLGFRLFADAPFSRTLRALDLSDNHLGRHGAHLLTSTQALAKVRHLRLKQCGMGAEEVEALVDGHVFEALTRLDLQVNDLTSDGAMILARSDLLDGVTHLNLAQNRIGDDGILALLESPHTASLQRLDLHWNPVTARSLRALDARNLIHDVTPADWQRRQ